MKENKFSYVSESWASFNMIIDHLLLGNVVLKTRENIHLVISQIVNKKNDWFFKLKLFSIF